MKPLIATLSLMLLIGSLLLVRGSSSSASTVDQPAPDIFPCNGCNISDVDRDGDRDMQDLNPLNVRAKQTRAATYRLLLMSGCSLGTVPADMGVIETELRKVGFSLTRNDSAYNFTVRVNCGTEHIRICGSINIFCLGRGFPYVADVEISDIISTYYPESRYSILCHEICGHALATWNEQYCPGGQNAGPCAGLARFASTPGWIDFMNTGPNSRHLFQSVELGRWERTMYPLQVACSGDPCWDGVFWVFSSGWRVNPATDEWFDPRGRLFWQAADQYGWRYSPVFGGAWPGGTPFWHPEWGHLFQP